MFSERPIEYRESSAVLFDVTLQPYTTLDCMESPLKGQDSFTLKLQCGFGKVISCCLNIFLLWELIMLERFGREL